MKLKKTGISMSYLFSEEKKCVSYFAAELESSGSVSVVSSWSSLLLLLPPDGVVSLSLLPPDGVASLSLLPPDGVASLSLLLLVLDIIASSLLSLWFSLLDSVVLQLLSKLVMLSLLLLG